MSMTAVKFFITLSGLAFVLYLRESHKEELGCSCTSSKTTRLQW